MVEGVLNGNYEQCDYIAKLLRNLIKGPIPKILMVMGTGLTNISKLIKITQEIHFCDIPNFPCSSAESHHNKFVIGHIGKVPVIIMCGRIHFYETESPKLCVLPLRVLALLGVMYVMVTGAVGGVNSSYQLGDFVLLTDHLYFPGFSGGCPLMGPNDERFGNRFVPLKDCYDPQLIKQFEASAQSISNIPPIHKGIYACVAGPHFETPAEIRFLRMAGADVVGMSVVPEIITAAHLGLKSFGVCVVTNVCDDGVEVNFTKEETIQIHKEIVSISDSRTLFLHDILEKFLENIPF